MEYFTTSDIGTAAVLISLGYEFQGLDDTDGVRKIFLFEQASSIGETIGLLYQGKLRVDPLALLSAFRMLKNKIHQE